MMFSVGVPAVGALVVALPHGHHLALHVAITIVTLLGCDEVVGLFAKRSVTVSRWFVLPFSTIPPVATYLHMTETASDPVYAALLALPFLILVFRRVFAPAPTDFSPVLAEVAGEVTSLIYPGFFALFLVLISSLADPVFAYLAFFSMVFINDTAAYVFGMLFGRNSQGVSPISPNKSIPGFVAGPAFSVGVALLFLLLRPDVFGHRTGTAIVTGAAVAAATVVGDLFESVLKRSAGVKDSGVLIPGRGGILDSVDSVMVAAPVFYFLIRFFA